MQYYIGVEGQIQGPIEKEALLLLWQQGKLKGTDLCWYEGKSDWGPLSSEFPEFVAVRRPPTIAPSSVNAIPSNPPPAASFQGPLQEPPSTTKPPPNPYATGQAPTNNEIDSDQIVYFVWWQRLLAFVVDYFAIALLNTILTVLVSLFIPLLVANSDDSPANDYIAIIFIFLLVALFLGLFGAYHGFFESSRFRATPGKILLGLVVADYQGKPISFWRGFSRGLAKLLNSFTFGLSFALCLFTAKRQCIQDMLTQCIIIQRPLEP